MKINDNEGNRLILANDGIYLKLRNKPMPLQIFTYRSGTVYKFVKKSNIFNPRGGKPMVGFNYYALKLILNRTKAKTIMVRTSNKYYLVQIEDIIAKGSFLHFLKLGFEKQVFYTIDDMVEQQKKKVS